MARPTAFRIPVAWRVSGPNRWRVWFALNRQIPARVASSLQGRSPGDSFARSSTWQLFVAEPLVT